MSSTASERPAQHAVQALGPALTGQSASAVWARRSPPLVSARTVLRRISLTVLISHVHRVRLVRSLMPIAGHALRVVGRHTLGLASSVQSAALRMSSTASERPAQHAVQALGPALTGQSASAVWARRSPPLVSARTVLRRISLTVLISHVHRVRLVRSLTSFVLNANGALGIRLHLLVRV